MLLPGRASPTRKDERCFERIHLRVYWLSWSARHHHCFRGPVLDLGHLLCSYLRACSGPSKWSRKNTRGRLGHSTRRSFSETDLDGVVSPIEGRCSWHPDPDLDRSDALRARGKPLRHVHLIRHCRCYHPSPLPASIRIELTVVCCQGFDLHA
uniref:(northern house mosquito) hypothetical protein n=1 Tax=Culex pipiens TaxID=7175 RepID=A0A8D8B0J0_CULPI